MNRLQGNTSLFNKETPPTGGESAGNKNSRPREGRESCPLLGELCKPFLPAKVVARIERYDRQRYC
jgi:hypothetical protein